MNLVDFLFAAGRLDACAVTEGSHSYTYAGLAQAVDLSACWLQQAGVKAGDHVALRGANSLFWIACYLGVMKLGAVCVPLSAQTTREGLRELMSETDTRFLCIDEASVQGHGLLEGPCVLREAGFNAARASGVTVEKVEAATIVGDELAALMLTSGSTRRPRAVMVTHANIIANTRAIIEGLGLSSSERILCPLPLSYCFGASLLHTHLAVGGSIVLERGSFQPFVSLRTLAEEGCTGFAGVPSIFQILLRTGSSRRISVPSCVRKVQQAGGRLPGNLITELQLAAPEAEIFVMYGQSEATARLTFLPPRELLRKMGSVGIPVAGVTIELLLQDGSVAATGELGEVCVSGPSVAKGYWRDSELSEKTFGSGHLKTGDLGYKDEDGFLFLAGRMSEFIKSAGVRLAITELEDCVITLPEILEAAAVTIPDRLRGEAMRLGIVCTAGSTLTAREVLHYCRQHVSSSLVPREVVVLREMPKNASGKLNKAALQMNLASLSAIEVYRRSRGAAEDSIESACDA